MRLKIYLNQLPKTEICLITMAILNFIIVLFMALVPALTQIRASNNNSLDFLRQLESAPIAPSLRVMLVVFSYFLIILCLLLKKIYYSPDSQGFLWLSIYEIILVACLMYFLDMSYNGIILLVVAEFSNYIGTRKNWMGIMIITFLIYLVCNYNIVNIIIKFNPFSTWASFYGGTMEAYLLGIETICEMCNIVLMILFIFFVISRDKREKKEIKELNMKLAFANDNLKEANEQLHLYALEQEQMGEMKERNRLAREIHDTLGHILTGISVGVDAVQVLLDISPDAARAQLQTIGDMARNGLNDVRRSVRKLKPDSLETKTLDHAIHDMVKETSQTTGAKIYFVAYGKGIHYEPDEEETIYRMVQEGTTNALRHGGATEVWIRLDRDESGVTISLDDNGKGSEEITEGFGLTHMRERVEMLGGSIRFWSDHGFHILAAIPIRQTGGVEE